MKQRLTYHELVTDLSTQRHDILFVGTPSTFYHAESGPIAGDFGIVDAQTVRYTTSDATLMGDQDHEPNHGIFYAVGYLTSQGVRAAAIDLNLSYYVAQNLRSICPLTDLENIIGMARPSLIAISAMTPNVHIAHTIAERCRKAAPDATIIIGGIATCSPQACENHAIDYVVIGDAEDAVIDIWSRISSSKPVSESPFVFKGQPLRSRPTLRRSIGPDYGFVPTEVPLVPRLFHNHGCSARCGFCSPAAHLQYKVGQRATEAFLSDVSTYGRQTAADYFLIGDLTFYLESKPVQSALKQMAMMELSPWWCQTQARFLSDQNIDLLAQAGCRQVAVGFEDLESSEKEIRFKNPGLDHAKRICESLKKRGIETQSYWMFGMPLDTYESSIKKINQMIAFARDGIMDAFHISYLIPYPATPYMENDLVKIERPGYELFLGPQGGYYNTEPMHRTKYLSSKDIYLLTRLAVSSISNELRSLS